MRLCCIAIAVHIQAILVLNLPMLPGRRKTRIISKYVDVHGMLFGAYPCILTAFVFVCVVEVSLRLPFIFYYTKNGVLFVRRVVVLNAF